MPGFSLIHESREDSLPGTCAETTTPNGSSFTTKEKWDAIAMSCGKVFASLGQEAVGDIQLPSIAQCAVHLELLNSFVILRARVMRWALSCHSDPESCWHTFVRLATIRFAIWIRSVNHLEIANLLPPLDVLLVWHSFMLNPGSYIKFCKTLHDSSPLEGLPWTRVHQSIDAQSGAFNLSVAEQAKAESLGLHADLLDFLEQDESLGPSRKGFGSAPWESTDDQSMNLDESSRKFQYWKFIGKGKKTQLSMRVFREMAGANFTYCSHSLQFDPSAAVHRQARFAEKMAKFGWLQSPTLGSTLRRANDRYSNFFSLVAKFPGMMVPTLDVDLVWHTHQLSPARYIAFCRAMTDGRFIDHNDTVEEGEVRDGFHQMQDLYRKQFAEEYLVCHSWYCEAGRIDPGVDLSNDDYAILRLFIMRAREHRDALGLPITMEFAECRCLGWEAGLEAGVNQTHSGCNAQCGSSCNGHCHSDCSTTCCGDCNFGCGSG